jgi:hypothetical protein
VGAGEALELLPNNLTFPPEYRQKTVLILDGA